MTEPPKFKGPDGVFRESFIFSTQKPNRFFTGSISPSTIDMQISIRGGPFVSDPDLITFEGEVFTVPDPVSYPDGLDLATGLNEIKVRSIDSNGTVSGESLIQVTLIQDRDVGLVVSPPTGIVLERKDQSVLISVVGGDDRVRGYNFYASSQAGGGAEGYSVINFRMVTDGVEIAVEETLGNLVLDATLKKDNEGNLAADPFLYNFTGSQKNSANELLQSDFNEFIIVPETVEKVRTNINLSSVNIVNKFSFEHNRQFGPNSSIPTVSNGAFVTIPDEQSLYYVVTAIYYDEESKTEIESTFSEEVAGYPLTVRTTVGSFPLVRREEIVNDVTLSIFRTRPEINLKPGSVVRDVFIDPFSKESSRIRFGIDFFHRAQSFSSLLRIDDPASSGSSVPVSQSTYKQALKQAFNLVQDVDVQDLIDQSFEKIAGNFGVSRLIGRKSRGEVVFYTTRRPSSSLNIPIGSTVSAGSVVFRTTRAASITLENIASFFSPLTGRYSVRVAVEAQTPGVAGDVGPGQITTPLRAPSGLSVTNDSGTFGGKALETNQELAQRALSKLAGVDSGTLQGIKRIASNISGVLQTALATPGDSLMQRDISSLDGEHKGGKVDVWVLGSQISKVTDTFAFSFQIEKDIQFEIFGDPSDLTFKAVGGQISESSPIIEMLDFSQYGYEFRNDSTGAIFDLTGHSVLGFDTIQLSSSVPQPLTTFSHVLRGSVRYRLSNKYIFPRQPVTQIKSFTGEVTGEVSSLFYSLVENSDPLFEGRSKNAKDYIQLEDTGDVSIPSGIPLENSESVVILSEYPEYVSKLGVNPLTIRVFNQDRSVEYLSPFNPSGSSDYLILSEVSESSPLAIQRIPSGQILSGETLQIDYFYDENFVVSYNVDFLIDTVQNALDEMKHANSDILVKRAIPAPVEIEATVVLVRDSDPAKVRRDIRTRLLNFIGGLGLGRPLRKSDVVSLIDRTQGVSYVQIPLTKMVKSDNSLAVREPLVSEGGSVEFFLIEAWSTPTVDVFLLKNELDHATSEGGGEENLFKGVFKNDILLSLQNIYPDRLGESIDRSFILGNKGKVIPGYSDDATLNPSGMLTLTEIMDVRTEITSNRIIVSVPKGELPSSSVFYVTYRVFEDEGVKNIEPGEVEYLALGSLELTFDEDRKNGR